jgi:hypothetical protein
MLAMHDRIAAMSEKERKRLFRLLEQLERGAAR